MISFDAASTQTGQGTISWSHTTNSFGNRILVVGITSRIISDQNVSDVTYDGTSLTKLAELDNNGCNVELWYLLAPAAGTKTIQVTMTGTDNRDVAAGARTYSGIDQVTPFGTDVIASGISAAPSVTVSSASGELVIDHAGILKSGSGTPGAGQTERYDVGTSGGGPPDQRVTSVGSEEDGAASVVMDWTMTVNDDWVNIGVPLKPSAAVGTKTVPWIQDDMG